MGVVQLGVSGHSFFLLMFAPPLFLQVAEPWARGGTDA